MGGVAADGDDLASLPELDEDILLHRLHSRYTQDRIYTYVGDILLAVNPFRSLAIYDEPWRRKYREMRQRSSLPPHIFAVADHTYRCLRTSGVDQVCVISGESGAGKTETAKLLIGQVLHLSRSASPDLQSQIVKVNPVLEALGNACTVMNHNSSRFGKFLRLHFDVDGAVVGASMVHYLLEKSRVVSHSDGERNFHIFYLMFAGLNEADAKKYCLHNPEEHRYLQGSGQRRCIISSSERAGLRLKFEELVAALSTIGFDEVDYDNIFTCLAAVLHCGDLEFSENKADEAVLHNVATLNVVAKFLGVDSSALMKALTTQETVMRGETISRANTVAQSSEFRDSLAKSIYDRLFTWVVRHLNLLLAPPGSDAQFRERGADISILDIFGFENFKTNSFEQFCINVANEQLQFYFNQHIFSWEQQEYEREGVAGLHDINFIDNKPVISLFFAKPVGLFHLLDDESKFHRATAQSLVQKFNEHAAKNKHYVQSKQQSRPEFAIDHYAGKVMYSAETFLDKNRDALCDALMACLQKSTCDLVQQLFGDDHSIQSPSRMNMTVLLTCEGPGAAKGVQKSVSRAESNANKRSVFRRSKRRSQTRQPHTSTLNVPQLVLGTKALGGAASPLERRKSKREAIRSSVRVATRRAPGQKAAATISTYFRSSLCNLMEKMLASTPHFVRCIKPNAQLSPDNMDKELVARQLRYTGVLETTRIRQMGYPTRLPFHLFLERYGVLASLDEKLEMEQKCAFLLDHCGVKNYAIGQSKVFLRYEHTEQLLNRMEALRTKVITVQKIVRGFLARRQTTMLREELAVDDLCDLAEEVNETIFNRLQTMCQADAVRHEEQFRQEREAREREERKRREQKEREKRERKEREQREREERERQEREERERRERKKREHHQRQERERCESLARERREGLEKEHRESLERKHRERQERELLAEGRLQQESKLNQTQARKEPVEPEMKRQQVEGMYAVPKRQRERGRPRGVVIVEPTPRSRSDSEASTVFLADDHAAAAHGETAGKRTGAARAANPAYESVGQVGVTATSGREQPWCIVTLMEKESRVKKFSLLKPSFTVDGSTELRSERIGINAIPAVNPASGVDKVRPFVGKGASITIDDDGSVWVSRYSKNNVFIKGFGSGLPLAFPAELFKTKGCMKRDVQTKVFDIDLFRQHLAEEVSKTRINMLHIFSICRLGISFVKDTPDARQTPCWIIIDFVARHQEVCALLKRERPDVQYSSAPWSLASKIDPNLLAFLQKGGTREAEHARASESAGRARSTTTPSLMSSGQSVRDMLAQRRPTAASAASRPAKVPRAEIVVDSPPMEPASPRERTTSTAAKGGRSWTKLRSFILESPTDEIYSSFQSQSRTVASLTEPEETEGRGSRLSGQAAGATVSMEEVRRLLDGDRRQRAGSAGRRADMGGTGNAAGRRWAKIARQASSGNLKQTKPRS